MEFNKKIETFKMFDLTFEIRKDKRTKYRIIFCQDKLIVGVENYLAYYKISKNWKISLRFGKQKLFRKTRIKTCYIIFLL